MARQPKNAPGSTGGQYAPDTSGKNNIPAPSDLPAQPTKEEYAALQKERDDSLTLRAVEQALMQMAARDTMPANIGEHGGGISYDSTVLVDWIDIGEGWDGDYNEDDPDDEPLLRYDAYIRLTGNPEEDAELEPSRQYRGWGTRNDSSYCTAMPLGTPQTILNKVADKMANELARQRNNGHWRRTAEEMSHANPTWADTP